MKEQTVSEAHFVIYVYEDEDEGEVDDDDVGHVHTTLKTTVQWATKGATNSKASDRLPYTQGSWGAFERVRPRT